MRDRQRSSRAWIAVASLAVTLGAPVLAWSARNASLGLDFSPAPVGASASRVYDIQRYRDHLLDPKERLPRVNARYWSHWKRPLGPEELVELDRKNGEWLDRFLEERSDRVLAAAPHRLLGLFSSFRISIWPPWDGARCDRVMWPIVKWISRALWLLSLAGLALTARRRFALWIWVVPVATLSAVHVLTVCNPRYMIPLMPLLFPYGGAAIMGVWGSVRRAARRFAQST